MQVHIVPNMVSNKMRFRFIAICLKAPILSPVEMAKHDICCTASARSYSISTLHRRLYPSSRLLNYLIAYYDLQCCSDRKGQGNEKSSITEICLTKQHGVGKCVFQIRRLCHCRWTLFRGNSGGFTKPYLSFEQGRGVSETRQVCKS